VSRDKLLAYLWPERDAERGRHALSQAVYELRQELGDDSLLVGVDDIRLNPAVICTDVAEFEDAIGADGFGTAVDLYGGPFLDGFFVSESPEFERWAEEERQRLAAAYHAALERLATDAARAGDVASAASWWRRRAAADPMNARIAIELMRALASAGERGAAIQHARIHAALLEQELGVGSDPEVEVLAQQLSADMRRAARPSPANYAAPDAAETVAPSSAADHDRQSAPILPPRTPAGSGRKRKRALWSMAGAVLLILVGSAIAASRSGDGSAVSGMRSVVLGTFTGTDSALALAVREALRAELQAAPAVRVLSDESVREALRLMRVPSDTAVAGDVATQVAQRRGATLTVTGSAFQLGTGLQLVAQLHDAVTGATLVTLSERPETEEDVIPAVSRLGSLLRDRVTGTAGDTLTPLPAVTTGSLPALRSYALARRAAARGDRESAIQHGEAALVHDSLFALAHYLVADLLWYVDQQRHSDEHMARAHDLAAQLPPRERLVVRARYEHLVRDRPDSALVYWRLLARSHPDEPLAYEGMWWAHRALADIPAMAAAAESALKRDSTPAALSRQREARILVPIVAGDSAALFAAARSMGDQSSMRTARFLWAVKRGEYDSALALRHEPYYRHIALIGAGRLEEAARELELVRAANRAQDLPRALLLQARAEVEEGSAARARSLAREALAWLRAADLSPPAYARLAERTADVAARVGDHATIADLRRFLLEHDRGRNLPSFVRALRTIDACASFADDDEREAAELAALARPGMFYGRSVATIAMLEADALARAGARSRADSLYRAVLSGAAYPDGDGEAAVPLRRAAARALARHTPKSPRDSS
jgi:DNA-binding SARP family transcriptional activator